MRDEHRVYNFIRKHILKNLPNEKNINFFEKYWNNNDFDGEIISNNIWYGGDNLKNYNEKGNKDYKPEDIRYEFNNFFYRTSKETNYNKSENIIACFGCSNTFGQGLPFEETWPYKLNEYLGFDKWTVKNYGICGASNDTISRLIYNYTLKNTPKAICCFLPETLRMELLSSDEFVSYMPQKSNNNDSYVHSGYLKILSEEYGIYMFIKNYRFIESICKNKNIDFYWYTWSKPIFDFQKQKNGILPKENYLNDLFESSYNFCDEPRARDGGHFGKIVHEKIANAFYQKLNIK